MELIAFSIGHAGTTLTKTLDQLTTAFSAVRPFTGRPSTSIGDTFPAMDHNAKAHDYTLFKSLLDSITDLAQSRLLGIKIQEALSRRTTRRSHSTPSTLGRIPGASAGDPSARGSHTHT